MALNPHKRRPLKVLAGLAGITVVLLGLLFGANTWGSGQWTPKLGLDLEGGTQMVLEPVLVGTNKVSSEQLNQARDIIVQRVDANGVAGAEVTTRGGRNIVVSMPGQPTKATEEAIRKSSQMRFRPVIVAGAGMPQPTPTTTPSGTATGKATGSATPSKAPVPTATGATTTAAKSGLPQALLGSTTAPTPAATTAKATRSPLPRPPRARPVQLPPASRRTPVTRSGSRRTSRPGSRRSSAPRVPPTRSSTTPPSRWSPAPTTAWRSSSSAPSRCAVTRSRTPSPVPAAVERPAVEHRGDPAVLQRHRHEALRRRHEAPGQPPGPAQPLRGDPRLQGADRAYRQAAILNGQASITGGFTIESARDLANQLKFGALPMSFTLQTRENISPTLGGEQLRFGLVAGMIGLLLVGAYSLFQYRALGFVTIASIVIAGGLTYLSLTILGWSHNYRLDMAGVTGLVIAIGVTADSFIVYFERVRDEVREGRGLRQAVDTGWKRARRTILVADGVNFMAAIVLYFLASSGVRGFAFTLGLTTLIDILVVFVFTHPLMGLLAETEFFGGGHKWSGSARSDWAPRPRRATPDGAGFVATPAGATEGSVR